MNIAIYEDHNWLVVNKPTNFSTHASHQGDIGVVEWLELHLSQRLHICSRLDKGTSGVLLFAKTALANKIAQQVHEDNKAQKSYRFISNKRYSKVKNRKHWREETPLDGKECLTHFRLIDQGAGYFCYEAVIHRGRTHQIRRHAAKSGVPILGDSEYGGAPFERLCLHCCELDWPEIDGRVEVPMPESFSFLLQGESSLLTEGAISQERRNNWLTSIGNSFRLIHRGELALPVSVDIYDSYLSITGYDENVLSEKLYTNLQPLIDYLSTKHQIAGGIVRCHVRNPHQKKLVHDVYRWGTELPPQIIATEHDLSYAVNLNDSQHVGLFLDQRDSRRRIGQNAKGKRVANLFSFTCSFSATAIEGGAEVVFSIDLAGSTLKRGKDNFALNGLDQIGRGKFIKEDVLKWLARQTRKQAEEKDNFALWDLIICDPPVFASAGKGRGFHVEKQWETLAQQIRKILADDGVALFANNHRSGNAKYYKDELKKHFTSVVQLPPPIDFPSMAGQPDHVRIYWCQV